MTTTSFLKDTFKRCLPLVRPVIRGWAGRYAHSPDAAPELLKRLLVSGDVHIERSAWLVSGQQMRVDPFDAVGGEIYRNGEFEPETIRFLQRQLASGMVFVDVGANIGQYTLIAAGIVGAAGRVESFEPVPATFATLARNVKLNGYANVRCHELALSDRPGHAQIHLGHYGNSGASSLRDTINTDARVVDIRTDTLDRALAGLPTVDVIKIDVEGAELLMLKGAAKVLETFKPLLIMEFTDAKFTANFGYSNHDIARFLMDAGYEIFQMVDDRLRQWQEHGDHPSWYNVVCVHRSRSLPDRQDALRQ